MNKLVVTTVDGMEHVYHFTKDLVVHGGEGSGVEALEGMHEGAMVVIHYTIETGEPTSARSIGWLTQGSRSPKPEWRGLTAGGSESPSGLPMAGPRRFS